VVALGVGHDAVVPGQRLADRLPITQVGESGVDEHHGRARALLDIGEANPVDLRLLAHGLRGDPDRPGDSEEQKRGGYEGSSGGYEGSK
jgi:hypothetical protein